MEQAKGHHAVAAYDGESALEHARLLNPDLILSDVMMPRMSGLELVVRVHQFLPSCKILLMSGQVHMIDAGRDAAAKGHTSKILAKPFSLAKLLATLSTL